MESKSSSRFRGCGIVMLILIGIIAALLIAIGVGMQVGYLPDTAALPAGRIPERQLRQLEQMGVTAPGESVLFFYSAAIFDIRGDGNLFTDRRAISYFESEGTLDISEATYDEIESIEFEPADTWLDDSVITVTKDDDTSFLLYVSTETSGDKLFYKKLIEEWNKHKNKPMAAEQ